MVTIPYVAGIVDGEGCISISRFGRRFTGALCVANTDLRLLGELKHAWNGSLYSQNAQRYNSRAKESYQWVLSGQQASTLLEMLLPFLIVKRRQAELFIEFMKLKKTNWRGYKLSDEEMEERALMHNEMRKLNKKGR